MNKSKKLWIGGGRACRPLAMVITVLLAGVSLAGAAERPANSLVPVPGYVPQLNFSEKRTEQLVIKSDPAQYGSKWAEVAAVDTTSLMLKVNMAGLELSEINAETVFSLVLGDLAFEVELGDDPAYALGKTSAFFPTHGWREDGSPEGKEGLELSWTADVLTVNFVNSANSEQDYGPYAAAFSANYAGENNTSVEHLGVLALNFGPLQGDATVFLKGTASTTVEAFEEGDYRDQFELTQSSLTGSLDLASPKVVVKGTEDVAGGLVLKGTAVDGFGLSRVEVSLDSNDPTSWRPVDLERFAPFPAEEDDWGGGSVDWSFVLPPDVVGQTVILVRAVDQAGNVSAPISFTVVRDLPSPLVGRWDALINGTGATPGLRGALTFQCSAAGAVSGRLTMNGRGYPFLGEWTGGEIQGRIRRGTEGDLILRGRVADLDVQDVQGAALYGYLFPEGASEDENGIVGDFHASRSPYSSKNRVSDDLVGRYNASFMMWGGEMSGASLLSMKVNGAGGVQVLGRLADGSQVSWGGVLGANGEIPLFAPSYARKGYLAARVYTNGYWASSDTVSWVRPANFGNGFRSGFELHGASEFTGVRYSGAEAVSGLIQSGELEVSVGGGSVNGQRVPVSLNERGRVAVSGENPMGLRTLVNVQTGWVTAGLRLPAAQEGAAKRPAKANGLLVGDRIVGHVTIGGEQPQVGQFGLARAAAVQDPGSVANEGDMEFLENLTDCYAFRGQDGRVYFGISGEVNSHCDDSWGGEYEAADGSRRILLRKLPKGSVPVEGVRKQSFWCYMIDQGQQTVRFSSGTGQLIEVPVLDTPPDLWPFK